jgi:hypothetical protein
MQVSINRKLDKHPVPAPKADLIKLGAILSKLGVIRGTISLGHPALSAPIVTSGDEESGPR